MDKQTYYRIEFEIISYQYDHPMKANYNNDFPTLEALSNFRAMLVNAEPAAPHRRNEGHIATWVSSIGTVFIDTIKCFEVSEVSIDNLFVAK